MKIGRALVGAGLGIAAAKMIGDAFRTPMLAAAQASCATGDQAACQAVTAFSVPAGYASPAGAVGALVGAWLMGGFKK